GSASLTPSVSSCRQSDLTMLERLRARLRALLRGSAMNEELDEELQYHLDRETERNVARGMSHRDAATAARRAFGNPTQLKEQVRDSWGRRWLERLDQDTRYALRSFRRAPTFSTTVVLTIALALGLNTTAFSIFSGNYFSMLGVGAALGRTLIASDAAAPGAEPVVVLSHNAWKSRFGGDSSIIGKTIRVRGHALHVVGVAAAGFGGLGEVPLDF